MIDPRTGKLTTRDTTSGPIPTSMYECDRDRLNLAQIDNEQLFRRILDEANRANTSFYPIDPRGLPVFDSPIVPSGQVPGPPPPTLPLTVDAALLRTRTNSLRTLAENTDGIAIVNSNDLANGFKRIVDDLSSLTVIEAAELAKMLEEKWGVSAAAPVAAAAAGAAAPVAEAVAEKTEFDVILATIGEKKLKSRRRLPRPPRSMPSTRARARKRPPWRPKPTRLKRSSRR